jgi:hypothetical protein
VIYYEINKNKFYQYDFWGLGIGDWGFGVWGFGVGG